MNVGSLKHSVHRFVKLFLLVTAIAMLAATVWPEARLALVWAAGRCQGCSFRSSVRSHALLVDMARAGEEIGAASKVVERDPKGFDLVETPMGRYWTQPRDRFLKFMLAEEKLDIYDGDAVAVRHGYVVLDCGANVGVFTRLALERGARLMVSIEPAPATIECLRRNFEREISQGRVIIVPKGVWDHTSVLELALGDDGNTTGDSFVLGRGQRNKVTVSLTTIDILTSELKLPRVDFIKMDIEGAEKQALRGAAETVRKYLPRMAIASEHLPDDVTAIPRVVSGISARYDVRSSSCKDAFMEVTPEVLLFQPK